MFFLAHMTSEITFVCLVQWGVMFHLLYTYMILNLERGEKKTEGLNASALQKETIILFFLPSLHDPIACNSHSEFHCRVWVIIITFHCEPDQYTP